MLHDVIVKVEDFYFPVYFLVLDYISGERTKQPTVILGRLFLATANAKIDCRTGTVDLAFGNHKLRLNVFTHVNNSPVDDECFMANIIDECVPFYVSVVDTDGTTETCYIFDRLQVENNKQLEEEEKKLEVAALRGDRFPWSVQVEPLPEKIVTGLKPSLQEAPKVELKELPSRADNWLHTKYTLRPIKQKSAESALLKVMVANKQAIGWTIVDLKGISPSIVMHKILTDPDVKPAHDAQRRLNPNMREVVKKEVLKWIDAGIIFAISDITWDAPFDFNEECAKAFDILKQKLVEAPILQSPDWKLTFEIMFDASDYAVGAVLGQLVEKKPVAIYYASKTLSDALLNYTTTEKEFLAVVYTLDKFRSYIWGSKEFDLEIRDKNGIENVVADHLSRIVLKDGDWDWPINKSFPDEQILAVSQNPWFTHTVNFKVAGDLPERWPRMKKKHLVSQAKQYIWDDHDLYKIEADQMIRYGADHRIAMPYHPQMSGEVEDWSTKLTDALWAYRTAFKTPIGTTPYRLVYGKDCHLPVEIAQRAYWATNVVNTSYDDACKARKLALCEIEELRDKAYECASAYKVKMKKVHDAKIRLKSFEIGQKVWLYNTRMKLFPGKLKSKWTGPFVIVGVGNHEQFEIEDFDDHIRMSDVPGSSSGAAGHKRPRERPASAGRRGPVARLRGAPDPHSPWCIHHGRSGMMGMRSQITSDTVWESILGDVHQIPHIILRFARFVGGAGLISPFHGDAALPT
ncbi:uncharacterized protein LOC143621957 [Bidens hawaiensis]|uniref:uncharacterized protein LOC143621957 n=1 Tax=Bidens hawaiensis TaxID=980011 RepID=UPI00404B49A7